MRTNPVRYDDAIKTQADAAAACAMSMKLPPAHRDVLSFLCAYLNELASHEDITQMGPPNLAVTTKHCHPGSFQSQMQTGDPKPSLLLLLLPFTVRVRAEPSAL